MPARKYPSVEEIIGKSFTRWVVLRAGQGKLSCGRFVPTILCRCHCGNEVEVAQIEVQRGKSKSCGCLIAEVVGKRATIHGHCKGGRVSAEFSAWKNMRRRCSDPKIRDYHRYGGRGIKVCAAWEASFEAFLAAVGSKPSPRHSLDRIDPDGNYKPGNVRWATPKQQAANKSKTVPPRQRKDKRCS